MTSQRNRCSAIPGIWDTQLGHDLPNMHHMIVQFKNRIHQIAPELQFWGYEGGNVLAAIAGVGGFLSFQAGLRSVGDMQEQNLAASIAIAFTDFSDILVTVGLIIIVLATIAFDNIFRGCVGPRVKTWVDRTASVLGVSLVVMALYFGASWITFTTVSFVSASALLRLCRTSPVFLKLGGLMLAVGGFGLATYGLSTVQISQLSLLPLLTILTGVYVIFASLMTYQGGVYECKEHANNVGGRETELGLFHPRGNIGRWLETRVDRPINTFVELVSLSCVFWVSSNTNAGNYWPAAYWR